MMLRLFVGSFYGGIISRAGVFFVVCYGEKILVDVVMKGVVCFFFVDR